MPRRNANTHKRHEDPSPRPGLSLDASARREGDRRPSTRPIPACHKCRAGGVPAARISSERRPGLRPELPGTPGHFGQDRFLCRPPSPPPGCRARGGRRNKGQGPACSAHTAGLCAGGDQGQQIAPTRAGHRETGELLRCCWPCVKLSTHRTSQSLAGRGGRGWGQAWARAGPRGAAHSLSPSAGLRADRPHPRSVQSRSGQDNTFPAQSQPEDAGQKHCPAWDKGLTWRRGHHDGSHRISIKRQGSQAATGAQQEMRLAGPGKLLGHREKRSARLESQLRSPPPGGSPRPRPPRSLSSGAARFANEETEVSQRQRPPPR